MIDLPFAFAVIDKVDIGILVLDDEFNIVLWNNWLERFTGRQREETVGQSIFSVCPRFAEPRYQDILNKALVYGQRRFCSNSLHKNVIMPLDPAKLINKHNMQVEPINTGDNKLILIQMIDVTGHQTRISQLKNILREVESENELIKAAEIDSRRKALHDPLTGLPNRILLYDRISHEIDNASRKGKTMAIMFLDIDGFKRINDSYGHEAGDKLLQSFASRIVKCLRQNDTVARLGGDEFVVVLPEMDNRNDILRVGCKIRSSCEKNFQIEHYNINITVSIGISIFPEDGRDGKTLLKKADSAMYSVKASGKNNVAFFA